MSTIIKYADLVETVSAALQYISYYHPADFIAHLARAYDGEASPAAKDAMSHRARRSARFGVSHRTQRIQSDGSLRLDWTLPDKVAFGATLKPVSDGVDMELWLRNGTAEPLERKAGLLLIDVLPMSIGIGLPGDPPDGLIASLIGLALMGGSFWLAGKIASNLWEAWDERERKIALQPVPQWRSVREIELPLWLCGFGALTLLAFAATGNWWFALPALVLMLAATAIAALLPKGEVRMG